MQFGLVCHFIKRADGKKYGYRHHKLRTSLNTEGRALIAASELALFTEPTSRRLPELLGIDAASNELHAPPEVFAPVFRYLRLHGARNFTYHVGEDFIHLLSGIRAINEAVTFLELRSGNRIGHGVAIGINPELWLSRVGDHIVMRQGDYLDDLVFAYYRLMIHGGVVGVAMQLSSEIEKYSRAIYGVSLSPQVLHSAWEFRHANPLFLAYPDRINHLLHERERAQEQKIMEKLDGQAEAKAILASYHGLSMIPGHNVREEWETLVEVKSAVVPPDAMRSMQEMQLEELIEKKIAIESLPTSNVRIGFYRDFSEHHLFRWLGFCPESGKQPVVVIGSDDPGIFATSIRAEYFHIYRVLTTKYERTPDQALEILTRLHRNADAFRFSPESNLRV